MNTPSVPIVIPTLSQDSEVLQNIMIVKQIAENYHKTHTSYGTQTGEYADIYVCGDMAMTYGI